MLGGALRGFSPQTSLLSWVLMHRCLSQLQLQIRLSSGCCLYKLNLLNLDFAVHQLVHVHSCLGAPRRARSGAAALTRQQSRRQTGLEHTLPASMSINTKLGRVLLVTLLNAPVADPGFIKKRSSSLDACARVGRLSELRQTQDRCHALQARTSEMRKPEALAGALNSCVWPVTSMSTSSLRCRRPSASVSPQGTTCKQLQVRNAPVAASQAEPQSVQN